MAGGRLGFIGLGMMGMPMALAAARAGVEVMAHDATPGRAAEFVALAGEARGDVAGSAAEVGGACRVVVLMLPTSAHVASVVEELAGAMQPGGLVIDMGSSVPGETRRLAGALAARGVGLIDAPVSGSVAKAKIGTLAIMVGGGDGEFALAEPFLKTMGSTLIRTGAVGSAHAMKALNNFVYAAGLLAASEAMRLGARQGLDLGVLTDVLNASSGRNVATETKLRQCILPGSYDGGFQLGLMAKDLETAGAIAAEGGYPAESLALCRQVWQRALASLGGRADNTEIHRFLPE
ncbi:MAG: oxidoreductase [Rhodospirillales bacterium 70-18]|nr:MAG: oxidoreductase [Rhodospirillales bacterium 70-18]